jgi:ribosomal protein L40E
VSTKLCPNCNADVPAIANLCKHCFHDFHRVEPRKKSPLWTLLFLALGTSLVSAMAFAHIYAQQKVMNISIDRETASIVFTTKYPDRTDAERVKWSDVSSVEYLLHGEGKLYQVWVVTTGSKRYLYSESDDMLTIEAHRLAETIGRPLVERDATAAN